MHLSFPLMTLLLNYSKLILITITCLEAFIRKVGPCNFDPHPPILPNFDFHSNFLPPLGMRDAATSKERKNYSDATLLVSHNFAFNGQFNVENILPPIYFKHLNIWIWIPTILSWYCHFYFCGGHLPSVTFLAIQITETRHSNLLREGGAHSLTH